MALLTRVLFGWMNRVCTSQTSIHLYFNMIMNALLLIKSSFYVASFRNTNDGHTLHDFWSFINWIRCNFIITFSWKLLKHFLLKMRTLKRISNNLIEKKLIFGSWIPSEDFFYRKLRQYRVFMRAIRREPGLNIFRWTLNHFIHLWLLRLSRSDFFVLKAINWSWGRNLPQIGWLQTRSCWLLVPFFAYGKKTKSKNEYFRLRNTY